MAYTVQVVEGSGRWVDVYPGPDQREWFVHGMEQRFDSADAAFAALIGDPIGDVRVPEDMDPEWAARWDEQLDMLRQGFEYELCNECGGDLLAHIIAPGPLGEVHAWCQHDDD